MVLGTFTLKRKPATDAWMWSPCVPIKATKLGEAADANLHEDSSTVTATVLHKKRAVKNKKTKSPRSNLSPTEVTDLFFFFFFMTIF